MIISKVPIIASPLRPWELGAAFRDFYPDRAAGGCFQGELGKYFPQRDVFLTSSGRSSLYILLNILKNISPRKEILLPAFTAPGLGMAVKKAGLKMGLADISLETFNLDIEKLPELLSRDILAIIPVHMFGLACDIEGLAGIIKGRDIFLVEDFAQSMGTTLKGEETGALSNIAFTSFGRGKNLPTYSGGMLTIKDSRISRVLEEELKEIGNPGRLEELRIFLKWVAFSLVSNPRLYGLLWRWARTMAKEGCADFQIRSYSDFQARLGLFLLKNFDSIKKKRYKNGWYLYQGLKGLKGIRLPRILEGSKPIFNRFPVLFEEVEKKRLISARLNSQGIEALPLYDKPLHKIYPELNRSSNGDAFPRATYFADRHLCLPTHPQVRSEHLDRMLQVFEESL